ncbi:MAG: N,N-dimethylformamidase beta subunit family domain-containing protein, partial [Planctomycetota bacterium]
MEFSVSSSYPAFDVEVLRTGGREVQVARERTIRGREQQVPARAFEAGCGWDVVTSLRIPEDWPSGAYLARLRPPGDAPFRDIPFVVRAARPGAASRILTLSPDCTTQAYNAWGGKSLYVSAYGPASPIVSFLRPIDPDGPGARQWPRNFLDWLAAERIALEFASDADLHRDPSLLDPYDLLLLFGHHEYWSKGMRDALDAFVGNGGRVLLLAGNTLYMQVRFEADGTAIRCHKRAREDPWFARGEPDLRRRVTTGWEVPPVLDPPDRSIGLGYRNAGWTAPIVDGPMPGALGGLFPTFPCEEGFGAYRVVEPEHPAFEGLQVRAGDLFGRRERPVAGRRFGIVAASGEVDGANLEWVGGRAVAGPAAPRNLLPLALAPAMTGFVALSSFDDVGTVVNAGSAAWARYPFGLVEGETLPDVARVTANLLAWLSRPRRSRVR